MGWKKNKKKKIKQTGAEKKLECLVVDLIYCLLDDGVISDDENLKQSLIECIKIVQSDFTFKTLSKYLCCMENHEQDIKSLMKDVDSEKRKYLDKLLGESK